MRMYDRTEFQEDVSKLVKLGFVVKRSNGPRTPATYLVDEAACLKAAKEAGY